MKTRTELIRKMLKYAEQQLQSQQQWARAEDFGRAAQYMHRAEALIEFVEIEHCGSVGGFGFWNGKEQKQTKWHHGLKNRLHWLLRVYGQKEN